MAGFPNYTYPAYGGYNPVTPFAPAPQIYQPMQQPAPQPVQAAQTVGSTNTQPNFFCRPVASREEALGVPVALWVLQCSSRTLPIMWST